MDGPIHRGVRTPALQCHCLLACADVTDFDVFLRLLVAMLFGGAIGLERERTNNLSAIKGMAGLRTHTLVCLGSCLIQVRHVLLLSGW